MWLSSKIKQPRTAGDADLGVTTIAGDSAGVVTRGEVRSLPVFGPGGYAWQPDSGDTVLVIRGGPGGEECCVAGAMPKDVPGGLRPGEICLHAPGGASVCLRRDGSAEICGGTIVLRGAVSVAGSLSINGTSCNAGTPAAGGNG
jgi:phage gp45-like